MIYENHFLTAIIVILFKRGILLLCQTSGIQNVCMCYGRPASVIHMIFSLMTLLRWNNTEFSYKKKYNWAREFCGSAVP